MQLLRPLFYCAMIGAAVLISSCVNPAYEQRLEASEKSMYPIHRQAMTWGQIRTYLAKATADERAAYLDQIGITQRFQALSPEDRQAVLARHPREGMSADAMRFLWGEPNDTRGSQKHYAYWYYWGSTLSLTERGNDSSYQGTLVEVYLVDNRVVWWQERVPSGIEEGQDDKGDTRR